VPQAVAAEWRGKPVAAYAELPTVNQTVKAKSVTVLPASDTRTLTTDVRLELPQPVAGVGPGTFARAHFATGRAKRLVVPAASVVQRSEVAGVYVVGADGRVQLRQVRLGARTPDGVEILAGVMPGERVALDPGAALAQLKSTK
jgi:multidrug efflux pump subunit AcrA (membrane-fusion protein)